MNFHKANILAEVEPDHKIEGPMMPFPSHNLTSRISSFMEISMGAPQKQLESPYDPALPLLGMYLKE
jgi:hypothetical protein